MHACSGSVLCMGRGAGSCAPSLGVMVIRKPSCLAGAASLPDSVSPAAAVGTGARDLGSF